MHIHLKRTRVKSNTKIYSQSCIQITNLHFVLFYNRNSAFYTLYLLCFENVKQITNNIGMV